MKPRNDSELKTPLEALYERYNKRAFVEPDPLQFLYGYQRREDREVVGLLASALAYGRVEQIIRSVAQVLEPLGAHPARELERRSGRSLAALYSGFRHRFTEGSEVAALLSSAGTILGNLGSLENAFLEAAGDQVPARPRQMPVALEGFVRQLKAAAPGSVDSLIPAPEKGSACKRLNLFMRWMVRRDEVDPGGWEGVPRSALLVPMDTHLFTIARRLGFTHRKRADLVAAIETTEAFSSISPGDPVKYDFALTRPGINPQLRALDPLDGIPGYMVSSA